MSLLDFLTKPRTSWQSGGSTSLSFPQVQSQDSMGYTDAPLDIGTSAPVQAMSAPQQMDKPSLLSEAWNWLKSPQGMMTISTGLRSASGDQDATGPALAYAEQQNKLAIQRQAIKAKNAALKAAYANGKFDPQAYMSALAGSDQVEVDPSDLSALDKIGQPDLQYIEGTDGIYQVNKRTGESRRVQAYPVHEQQAPPGFRWADDQHSDVVPLPGYIKGQGAIAAVKRAPPRPGGAGNGVPPLPPGFVIEK